MDTYILQKEIVLPGRTIPIGSKYVAYKTGRSYVYNDGRTPHYISSYTIKNNTGFFKKEEPIQWKILTYEHSGKVHEWGVAPNQYNEHCESACKITSVRRLSDNEVFTVGDRIHGLMPITSIDIMDNNVCWLSCGTRSGSVITGAVKESEPLPLPIKVTNMGNLKAASFQNGELSMWVSTTKEIPPEKYEPIKKAIEAMLQDEWENPFPSMYTENEMIEAQSKAFYAARDKNIETTPITIGFPSKYPTFADYIESQTKTS